MSTNAENTARIIAAIDAATIRTERQISDVNVGLAGLRSDVGYVKEGLRTLGDKVGAIDAEKAGKMELAAIEARLERQMALDIGRIEQSKIGHNEMSIDTFESVVVRLNEIEKSSESVAITLAAQNRHTDEQLRDIKETLGRFDKSLESLNEWKWKMAGIYTAVCGAGGLLGWVASKIFGGH